MIEVKCFEGKKFEGRTMNTKNTEELKTQKKVKKLVAFRRGQGNNWDRCYQRRITKQKEKSGGIRSSRGLES
ncbi:hypothetical protein Pyn_25393 [Prunus yedoensis var. nudiflora]|uniref:Uncharacterized protein n=1 Tax=Prunus yedoensis var. nudiflora TaxID=2094558 RepID=A0A314XKD7_PRUYE|nr:hypothetical protein Pyn_25393 [Prunus yedoensis var. nudiflora]